ncbi:hypothetical protein KJ885_04625 [Patescibacteria group bacterium]|nr:hypothetical protein [Patescibacteria group bacterium]
MIEHCPIFNCIELSHDNTCKKNTYSSCERYQKATQKKWWMDIADMKHDSGISYPVFEWSFGVMVFNPNLGFAGRTEEEWIAHIRAWLLHGYLHVTCEETGEEAKCSSIEDAFKWLQEKGLNLPKELKYSEEIMQSITQFQSFRNDVKQSDKTQSQKEEMVKAKLIEIDKQWKKLTGIKQ